MEIHPGSDGENFELPEDNQSKIMRIIKGFGRIASSDAVHETEVDPDDIIKKYTDALAKEADDERVEIERSSLYKYPQTSRLTDHKISTDDTSILRGPIGGNPEKDFEEFNRTFARPLEGPITVQAKTVDDIYAERLERVRVARETREEHMATSPVSYPNRNNSILHNLIRKQGGDSFTVKIQAQDGPRVEHESIEASSPAIEDVSTILQGELPPQIGWKQQHTLDAEQEATINEGDKDAINDYLSTRLDRIYQTAAINAKADGLSDDTEDYFQNACLDILERLHDNKDVPVKRAVTSSLHASLRYAKARTYLSHVPKNAADNLDKMKDAREFFSDIGVNPDTVALSLRSGLTAQEIEDAQLLEAMLVDYERYDESADETTPGERNTVEEVISNNSKEILHEIAEKYLSKKQKRVLGMRYGIGRLLGEQKDPSPKYIDEVAREIGVTRARIWQIEDKSLKILEAHSRTLFQAYADEGEYEEQLQRIADQDRTQRYDMDRNLQLEGERRRAILASEVAEANNRNRWW